MGETMLMQGNAAIAQAAMRAGCKYYFGYPITPSSEIAEHYAKKAGQDGIVYVQAETEVAAFNMVAGVAATGQPAMTATSGPGFCLGLEAMSFMSSAGLPAVVVDCMRPGPGDGEILASQGDYFQLTKGGGHGDYRNIVLAPYSVQELADNTVLAFDLAFRYDNPVILASDGALSKQWESTVLPPQREAPPLPNWALTGAKNRPERTVVTCGYGPEQWENHCLSLQEKFAKIERQEQRWQDYETEDADIFVVAYGSAARVARDMVKLARTDGLRVGLIRPITLWPFPKKAFTGIKGKSFFVVELSAGQMVEDVCLSVGNDKAVLFYGKLGGTLPTAAELYENLREQLRQREGSAQ